MAVYFSAQLFTWELGIKTLVLGLGLQTPLPSDPSIQPNYLILYPSALGFIEEV